MKCMMRLLIISKIKNKRFAETWHFAKSLLFCGLYSMVICDIIKEKMLEVGG